MTALTTPFAPPQARAFIEDTLQVSGVSKRLQTVLQLFLSLPTLDTLADEAYTTCGLIALALPFPEDYPGQKDAFLPLPAFLNHSPLTHEAVLPLLGDAKRVVQLLLSDTSTTQWRHSRKGVVALEWDLIRLHSFLSYNLGSGHA